MPSIDSLADETLQQIWRSGFDDLPAFDGGLSKIRVPDRVRRATLRSCALTCRRWAVGVVGVQYERVWLDDDEGVQLLLDLLSTQPLLRPRIKQLIAFGALDDGACAGATRS